MEKKIYSKRLVGSSGFGLREALPTVRQKSRSFHYSLYYRSIYTTLSIYDKFYRAVNSSIN